MKRDDVWEVGISALLGSSPARQCNLTDRFPAFGFGGRATWIGGVDGAKRRAAPARNAANPSEAVRRFNDGSWRIFRIKGDAPVGFDTVKVEAKKARKAEATLKVVVLDKKTVKGK